MPKRRRNYTFKEVIDMQKEALRIVKLEYANKIHLGKLDPNFARDRIGAMEVLLERMEEQFEVLMSQRSGAKFEGIHEKRPSKFDQQKLKI